MSSEDKVTLDEVAADDVTEFLKSQARYVVAWTGGYEEPLYFGTTNRETAQAAFNEWCADLKNRDRVDLLVIDGEGRVTVEQTGDSSDGEC